MKPMLVCLLAAAPLLFLPAQALSKAAIAVKVETPAGSSAQTFSKRLVGSILMTPCVSWSQIDGGTSTFGEVGPGPQTGVLVDNPYDQFTLTVKGSNSDDDKDGLFDYNLYFFLVNTGADGSADDIANARFYVFSRYDRFTDQLTPGVVVTLKQTAQDLDVAQPYLRAEDFIVSSISETILGGAISFDAYSLPLGTWLAVAILASETDVDFLDPRTWAKWDVFPFMLGGPWGDGGGTCERD